MTDTAPPSIKDSPEFQAALQEALKTIIPDTVNRLVAEQVQALAGAQKESKPDTASSIAGVLGDLAFAIANSTDPDNARKKIHPEELERRKKAFDRMGALLIAARQDNTVKPIYTVVSQTFLEEQLIQPFVPDAGGTWKATRIIWKGPPNTALRPDNDAAKTIYAAYLESIGGSTKNQAGVRDKPTWVSPNGGGLVFVGEPPQSVANRGLARDAAPPMELSMEMSKGTTELVSVDDPNATAIPILGTVAAPARKTAPGSVPNLSFAGN